MSELHVIVQGILILPVIIWHNHYELNLCLTHLLNLVMYMQKVVIWKRRKRIGKKP